MFFRPIGEASSDGCTKKCPWRVRNGVHDQMYCTVLLSYYRGNLLHYYQLLIGSQKPRNTPVARQSPTIQQSVDDVIIGKNCHTAFRVASCELSLSCLQEVGAPFSIPNESPYWALTGAWLNERGEASTEGVEKLVALQPFSPRGKTSYRWKTLGSLLWMVLQYFLRG